MRVTFRLVRPRLSLRANPALLPLLGLLLAFVMPAAAQSTYTTTLAGRAGAAAGVDGVGADARFYTPMGIVADAAGNLFVTDTSLAVVRKVTPAGVVTTFAGQIGFYGYADGTGPAARFSSPEAIAIDAAGNLFVADNGNFVIRKITPAGVVTTLAGTVGVIGGGDGPGPTARFRQIGGIAVDPAGNLYAADTPNRTIRKITPAGFVSTIAGIISNDYSVPAVVDGIGPNARFGSPRGIVIDGAGNLYVADSSYRQIRKINPQGVVTTLAGTTNGGGVLDGTGTRALFSDPTGLALHSSGVLYVLEPSSQVLRTVTMAGVVTTIAGFTGVSGTADGTDREVRFNFPNALVFGRGGDLYIADTRNYTIRRRGTVTAPVITTQPQDLLGPQGQSARLSVVADSLTPATYQWIKNGANLPGATNAVLALDNLRLDDQADYLVTVTNIAGTTVSARARLTVLLPATIVRAPAAARVDQGGTATFNPVFNSDGPVTLQWRKDGVTLPGATTADLSISNVNPTHAGSYTLAITNAGGTTVTAPAALTVLYSRFVNLSVRTTAGTDAAALIVGFVLNGATRPFLIRGTGPALAAYGVAGVLNDPRLTLYRSGNEVATNDDWSRNGNALQLIRTADNVGAFPLAGGSRDAALLQTLTSGAYTASIAAAEGAAGVALAEVYEVDPPADGRLVNVSARAFAGAGENALIAGFVLDGNTTKQVLIRAAGPALTAFGVDDALADPQLTVYRNGITVIAANDNWEDASGVGAAAGRVRAFPFATGSKDAAVLLTLAPGAYTAQIATRDRNPGAALIEVYEVP